MGLSDVTTTIARALGAHARSVLYRERIALATASTRDLAWWYRKANALAPACQKPITSIALLLSVATHETHAGEDWPGEHNWGATTRRALRDDERAKLKAAGIVADIHVPTAERTMRERAAMALLKPEHGVAIHTDSHPSDAGPVSYFTYFAAFDTDAEGAAYFATFFHTGAEIAAVNGTSIDALAAAMYHAGYYTGFHHNDPDVNIADYANACRPLYREALRALDEWYPGAAAPVYQEPADPLRITTRDVQAALNAGLAVDGVAGPATFAAVKAYQLGHGLDVTGYVDEATAGALRGIIR